MRIICLGSLLGKNEKKDEETRTVGIGADCVDHVHIFVVCNGFWRVLYAFVLLLDGMH